jgi:4'-phosphopantetheinyl transferase
MDVSDALDVLSADERERAARLHSGQDRDRFISARGLLRGILAEYVGSNARDLVFGYGPHGKPRLVTNPKDVRFNLSHSSNHVIFAFTVGQEIGVDLERLDSIAEIASIADQFFSAIETSRISRSPQNQRVRTFLSYWTCKEALAKAIGVGMSCAMTDHEFNFDASGQPHWANANLSRHWSLRTVRLDAEYAISFAIAGPIKSIKCFGESWLSKSRTVEIAQPNTF